MKTAIATRWSSTDYCFTPSREVTDDLAKRAYDRVCRVDFTAPGFCLIDLGPDASSGFLRQCMVNLKRAMQEIHHLRTGRGLIYLSAARFDQQVTTKFHRDGGPDECFLMLGYEPSEVSSTLAMADYSRCAVDNGMTPGEFLDRHNPAFGEGAEMLEPYITNVGCFSNRSFQIVLINNSAAPFSESEPAWQGVLHTATMANPSDAARRIVNSTMIAPVPLGTPEVVSEEEQRAFITTSLVRRHGYDRPHLVDDD